MRFAWSRASEADAGEGEPSLEVAPYELAAVELLTDEGRRVGWIATQGQRTSDWLNANADVPVLGLTAADDETAVEPPSLPAASPESLARDRIIWAVPPPLPANRHLRLHRRKVLVHLELDDWEVSGQAHVRPGADATDQMLRGTREMVPLTEVQVISRADRGEGVALPVLIVNRRHVRRVVVDTPHQSAAVPPPVETAAPVEAAAPAAVAAEPAPLDPNQTPVPQAAGAPIESGADLVHSALLILLETEVIDVVEFQSIRARMAAAGIGVPTPAPASSEPPG